MLNRNTFVLISVLLLFSLTVQGQGKISFEPRIGYGSFGMRDMEQLQDEVRRDSGIPLKVTDKFPAYAQYGFILSYHPDTQNRISLVLEKGSTGGRLFYSDYSGWAKFDQLLSYNSIGGMYTGEQPIGKFKLSYGLESSLLLSKMKAETEIHVYEHSNANSMKFDASGWTIKPFVGLVYPYKFLEARVSTGYLYNNSQPFHLEGSKDMIIRIDDKELKPNWSGLRINFSVAIRVGKQ